MARKFPIAKVTIAAHLMPQFVTAAEWKQSWAAIAPGIQEP